MMHRLARTVIGLLLAAVAVLISAAPAGAAPRVNLVDIDGPIDPIVASYLVREVETAQFAGVRALIVRLDTPGGLDISTRTMVQEILASRVPVIVWTAPSGARAASAGVFISLSAHVAAMAPGTTIGAAHPVNIGGGDVGKDMAAKVENDAAAFIRGIARQRGRNARWAEDAVRKSVSATAEEAVRLDVADFIAGDLKTLLDKADGRVVKVRGKEKTLSVRGADVVPRPMSFRQRTLHALVDPNIVLILLTLGIYGIIYELANPGFGFSGIGGAITIILGLYGLQALPINLAGLALIILAFVLFVAEAFTPTFGVLAGGGLIAFVLGGVILIDAPRPQLAVSGWVIAPLALLTLAFVVFVVRAAWQSHRRPPVSGKTGMVGLTGQARTVLDPEGQIFVHGEVWSAAAVDPPIQPGDQVRVVDIDGLRLKVEKLEKEG